MILTVCCCLKMKQVFGPITLQKRHNSLFNRSVHFLLKKNLFFINTISSGGCMGVGDLVQQEYEYRAKTLPERYNWDRAVKMVIVGGILGPLHHIYYVYLDILVPKVNYKTVLFKVACDQLIAAPLTILVFFYVMGWLEKQTLQETTKECLDKFKLVYLVDCLFWPPVQCINFYYLPTKYRVLYINATQMVYDVFLSYMKYYQV